MKSKGKQPPKETKDFGWKVCFLQKNTRKEGVNYSRNYIEMLKQRGYYQSVGFRKISSERMKNLHKSGKIWNEARLQKFASEVKQRNELRYKNWALSLPLEIRELVLTHFQSGIPLKHIAAKLNSQNLKNRNGNPWNGGTIKTLVRFINKKAQSKLINSPNV